MFRAEGRLAEHRAEGHEFGEDLEGVAVWCECAAKADANLDVDASDHAAQGEEAEEQAVCARRSVRLKGNKAEEGSERTHSWRASVRRDVSPNALLQCIEVLLEHVASIGARGRAVLVQRRDLRLKLRDDESETAGEDE